MGPGPGDYEPYTNVQNKAENLNAIEESTRFEARIPRYHEAIVKDEEKKVSISGIYSSCLKTENIQNFLKKSFFLFANLGHRLCCLDNYKVILFLWKGFYVFIFNTMWIFLYCGFTFWNTIYITFHDLHFFWYNHSKNFLLLY